MSKIEIRYQQIKDAKRFCEILANPNFIYFGVQVKSLSDEKAWLRNNPIKRKNNIEWNYTIIYRAKIIGSVGLRINQLRKYIGEIGYFLDEKYWGQGLTTKAVKLIEKEAFEKRGLTRLEILMRPENKASEKVAIKNGYIKEGRLRKVIRDKEGKMRDAFLYAKVL